MRILAIVALTTALATPAFAESLTEKTGVNSTLGVAPTTADFVHEVAISDMFEIQSSKLAETKSDEATRKFAARMIADHSKTSSELEPLAKAANVTLPPEMDSAHKDMLTKLEGLRGDDFAKKYHSDQDTAHKGAVSLFERYGKGGDNSALKKFANATLPTLKEHLKMAEDLDK